MIQLHVTTTSVHAGVSCSFVGLLGLRGLLEMFVVVVVVVVVV